MSLQRVFCEACDRHTTHAQGRCTECIRREGNRTQGYAYLGVGVVVALVGLISLLMAFNTHQGLPTNTAAPQEIGQTRVAVPHAVFSLVVLGLGAWLLNRGVGAVFLGRDPER